MKLRHIQIEHRLGRQLRLAYQVLQKLLRFVYDTAEQVGQPTMCLNGLACFLMDFLFLDFQYLCLLYPRHKRHIRRPVPLLPCGVIRFHLGSFGIVFADLLGRQIDTVGIEHP